mgnify:CR=1 FL=1
MSSLAPKSSKKQAKFAQYAQIWRLFQIDLPAGAAHPPRRLVTDSGQFGDQLDLDAGTQRNLRHAKGAARMRAGVSEDLAEQFRAAVGDQMLFGEGRGRVDQAHDLDDALDAVEVGAGGADGRDPNGLEDAPQVRAGAVAVQQLVVNALRQARMGLKVTSPWWNVNNLSPARKDPPSHTAAPFLSRS